jgi:hypothetical protein
MAMKGKIDRSFKLSIDEIHGMGETDRDFIDSRYHRE